MFELTANANPNVLVSIGKISLGINYPSGPHDHAKDITNKHVNSTTNIAAAFLSTSLSE